MVALGSLNYLLLCLKIYIATVNVRHVAMSYLVAPDKKRERKLFTLPCSIPECYLYLYWMCMVGMKTPNIFAGPPTTAIEKFPVKLIEAELGAHFSI